MPSVDEFKADLSVLDGAAILRKYILSDGCAHLTPQQHANLRERVAGKFSVQAREVVVVGSAKLGFSIAPQKRYRPFGESSDIDVVIVSPVLFDRLWREAYEYWKSGAYWEDRVEFEHYVFRGWIRPDKLPRSDVYPFSKDWDRFFRSLSASRQYGPYKISGAVYQADFFFQAYQRTTIDQCKYENENISNQ